MGDYVPKVKVRTSISRVSDGVWKGTVEYKDRKIVRQFFVFEGFIEVREVFFEDDRVVALAGYQVDEVDAVGKDVNEFIPEFHSGDAEGQISEEWEQTVISYQMDNGLR